MYKPWMQNIDLEKRILEIGLLYRPNVPKISDQNNIFYTDIRSTEEIKQFYSKDNHVDNDAIVSIDYVKRSGKR